ncbi:MAG: hypothetical protein EWM72_00083 [Nitrospira sp.]|nr:MAG: hypothetical protein EWM72_00083 [Nitrospira sp.]
MVGVSGGPDSVALLSLLHRLRPSWSLTLTAVHFNYGLRGAESDGDQEFVAAFCRELEIPLSSRRLDVRGRARGTSLQAAARDLRYRAMTDIAKECGADRIALGHTADDQAETVLLWMLRGAGLSGLSGMPAIRDGKFIRPLYETKRQDILAYLQSAELSFRQDSSNAKPLYLRNRIRQELMPVLKRLVPSSVDALCRLADVCREDDRFLDEQLAALCSTRIRQEIEEGWSIERAFVRELPRALQRRLVRDVLRRCDALHRPAGLCAVERILHSVTAKGTFRGMAAKSIRLVVGKDLVQFIPSGHRDLSHEQRDQVVPKILAVPSQVTWAGTGQTIRAQQLARSHVRAAAQGRNCIIVDADRVSGPLVVRAWQPGDRFHPLGMKGRSKKLQDFFTDLKVSTTTRRKVPVVVAPKGIVWVVGYRQDERWTLTAATERCLVITASEGATGEGV